MRVILGLVTALLLSASGVQASTIVTTSGTSWDNPAPASVDLSSSNITTNPAATIINSWYTDNPNFAMSPASVMTEINQLTPVSDVQQVFTGGSITLNPGQYTNPLASGAVATLWGLHFDHQFLTLLFNEGISSMSVLLGLPNDIHAQGISGVYAMNDALVVTPIPAPIFLFGSALVGLGILSRRKKKSLSPNLAA